MKKYALRMLAMICILALSLSLFAQPAEAAPAINPIKKIGLYYGSSGLSAANLVNHTGLGYSFGFYDSTRTFIAVAKTGDRALTVTQDRHYSLSGASYLSSDPASATGVICRWHLRYKTASASAAAAVQEAARVSALGYNAYPAHVKGAYYVALGQYASKKAAESALAEVSGAVGAELTVTGGDDSVLRITVTDTTRILFTFDSTSALGIAPLADAGVVAQTWCGGYRYYGGFEYKLNTNGLINVINVVDLCSYVKGVIPYEISASWPVEAQKAQALCAKCYAYSGNKHASSGFDLCDTACCQVYRGNNAATATSDAAVEAIMSKNITYNGGAITAYYSSSNGGASESSENVWTATIGYLRGKADPHEDASIIPNYKYTKTITAEQVATILRNKGYAVPGVADMYVSKYTDVGNVYTLTVVDTAGKKWDFNKSSARALLGTDYVKSQRFTVTGGSGGAMVSINAGGGKIALPVKDIFVAGASGAPVKLAGGPDVKVITGKGIVSLGTGKTETGNNGLFTITGTGSGHNVGMSQWGLYCMAKKNMTYDQMLKFYYTGVEISDLAVTSGVTAQ
ncbi:MAG: SpoIID/LytB domain-containing protein [Clostridia bacterium]|nr:SpoIID/LytB domain-containing protein [Clostridia bacterium]